MRPRYRCCETARLRTQGDTSGRGLELRDVVGVGRRRAARARRDRARGTPAHVARVRRPRRAPRGRVSSRPGSSPAPRSRRTSTTATSTSRACTRRSRCAASPVNVNYRYLEDELVYLLDNSDAEALFFHGSLGDRVAKVRDRAPLVKLWIQVDDGAPHQDFAVRLRGAPRRERADAAHRALRRRPLLPLHRRHHRHAEGRDVALRRPLGRARPARRTRSSAKARPSIRPRWARSRGRSSRRRDTAHLPASPLMHGTGAFTSFQAIWAGGRDRHARGPALRPARAVADRAARAVTQMAIVGDAFAKPMLQALEEAEADGDAVRHLVARS